MAKVNVVIDTDSDSMEITIDGEKLENVREAHFSLNPDWYDPTDMNLHCCIQMYEENSDSGVKKMTTLMAKNSDEARKLIVAGATADKKFKEFINYETSVGQLTSDITNYLSQF